MTLGDTLKNVANKVSGSHGTTDNNAAAPADPNAPAGAQGKGDFLDQGVGFAGQRTGHSLNRGQEEKVSDGIRLASNVLMTRTVNLTN
ncbi:hypothetical protein EMMF5_006321 [Cystobasidiomycetes sp. EMM_F5]